MGIKNSTGNSKKLNMEAEFATHAIGIDLDFAIWCKNTLLQNVKKEYCR